VTITQQLAEYVFRTSYEDIPREVLRYSKLCILDWLGVTLGGSKEEVGSILLDFVREMGGERQSTILGKGIRTNVLFAALVNGSMSHTLDFDDTHFGSSLHPSVCLAPAVVAVGEYKKISGKDLLAAFTLGFEVATRIGAAAGMSLFYHGWHATATVGRFGAVAGTAKILKLYPDEIVNAFGIAGTQVAGLRQVFGTMCKPFHAGKSAMDGLLSAFLARKGFDSSDCIIEGRYGFLNVYAPEAQGEKILADLGKKYQIVNVAFKPYASALATHPTIEAIKSIKKDENLNADDVLEIELELGRIPTEVVTTIKEPQRVLEGKFSIYHCAALAFIEGSVGQDMFTEEKLNDPAIAEFRSRVKTTFNPNLKFMETRVKVLSRDGRCIERFITTPKGFPENPMTIEEMNEKFTSLARPVVSDEKIKGIYEKAKKLEEIADITEIIDLCNP